MRGTGNAWSPGPGLHWAHLTRGPLCPDIHLVVTCLVPECVYGIKYLVFGRSFLLVHGAAELELLYWERPSGSPWPSLLDPRPSCPIPAKTAKKNPCTSGGMTEVSTIFRGLKDAGVVVSIKPC